MMALSSGEGGKREGLRVTLHQHSGCGSPGSKVSVQSSCSPQREEGSCVREFFKHRKEVQMRKSQNISTNYAKLSVAPILHRMRELKLRDQ